MKHYLPLAFITLSLAGCYTTPANQPPTVTLAQARIAYNATCGEVLRLRLAGKDLPSARSSCITADGVLDAADKAYAVGQTVQATQGATRAMVYITAAQALVAASGSVK